MIYGIDTQSLVDAVQNYSSVEYITSKTGNSKVLVSSIVFDEAYGILIGKMGNTKNQAVDELKRAIRGVKGETKQYVMEYGNPEAERLLKKYNMRPHEKDHKILAHYKGVGVKKIIVRDTFFENVIKQEGLGVLRVPTTQWLLDQKLSRLFRKR